MDLKTQEIKKIGISDVDYKGQYQLCHLFNRFATIATENALQIGMWNPQMMNDYGWVVAKQTLTLDQPIMLNDIIELTTIAGKGTFVAFPRYYFIYKDKKEIGRCSSLWTLIDIKNRRIVSPQRIGINIPQMDHQIKLDSPNNISEDIELHFITKRQVLYSDVDTNQHMNNTRYIQWAFDIIDYHIHENHYVKEISINYKKEIKPLEYVNLYLGQDQQRFIIKGEGEQGEIFFMIEIYFTERTFS